MQQVQEGNIGGLIRQWRVHRRLSQMDFGLMAGVSSRHLSFIETGRSKPSREMILQLARSLELSYRQTNAMLKAGGFAEIYRTEEYNDVQLKLPLEVMRKMLKTHDPFPAFVIDRHWNIVEANKGLQVLLEGVGPALLAQPANAFRISLHPKGLSSRIINFAQWRAFALDRLAQEADKTADTVLADLLKEFRSYRYKAATLEESIDAAYADTPFIPFRLKTDLGELNLFGTVTRFGTPNHVLLSELAVEQFFPADEQSAKVMRTLHSRCAKT
ncbi:MAG TPA: helix-turn-helix transcriptional regulator [Rickettsiales bacterium]|nr:helix-turn-helix transcriptional regulator [Rickettsiales bacterium]